MSPALEVMDLAVRLGGREVVSGASLAAHAGEIVGVIGPNGAGKTTLLRAALGLVKPHQGSARLAGRLVSDLSEAERARLAGYLPQDRRVAWSLPAWRIAALGAPESAPALARSRAMAALERVGLNDLAERGVLEMSGGERARVLLARLLVTQAPLLLADEPAASLDPAAQLLVMDLFREEAKAGRAVVVTLHDLSLAARSCDRLVVLNRGQVAAEGAPPEALTHKVLAQVFGLDGALIETPAGLVLSASRWL